MKGTQLEYRISNDSGSADPLKLLRQARKIYDSPLEKLQDEAYNAIEPKLQQYDGNAKSLKAATQQFRKNFLSSLIQKEGYGNISSMAKMGGVTREHLSREIQKEGLQALVDHYRPEDAFNEKRLSEKKEKSFYQHEHVGKVVQEGIKPYVDMLNSKAAYQVQKSVVDKLPSEARVDYLSDETIQHNFSSGNYSMKAAVDSFEKKYIGSALEAHDFDKEKTAEALDVSVKTLERKMKKHDLSKESINRAIQDYYITPQEQPDEIKSTQPETPDLDGMLFSGKIPEPKDGGKKWKEKWKTKWKS